MRFVDDDFKVISQELITNTSADEARREKQLTNSRKKLQIAKKTLGEIQPKLKSIIANLKVEQVAHTDAEKKEGDENIKKLEKRSKRGKT
ncbi:hypothetical protein TSUD_157660 [Trifolium subterraneum]|uniref:Uncharacterized protein n=1 Tax=Trifolium subterraneum TaxID=3900 RepID=A0A2Z6LZG6_TRISU|nr:hypothetical protein TSUD_157660 [Trifolium subterraneum]